MSSPAPKPPIVKPPPSEVEVIYGKLSAADLQELRRKFGFSDVGLRIVLNQPIEKQAAWMELAKAKLKE